MTHAPQVPPRAHWWQQHGEPWLLAGLLFGALTLALLAALALLTTDQALRGLALLCWLAGLVLLPRLAAALRTTRRRVPLASGLLLLALLGGLLASGPARAPEVAAEPLANVLGQEAASYTFKAPPRISQDMFAQLLRQGTGGGGPSPAAPLADDLYAILLSYELDPAVALAFFAQESQFCTTGICASRDMKSWGGQRAAYDKSREAGIVQGASGPFVSYHTWQDGLRDWCELILNRYVARGLDTVAKAVPVYAPSWDGNDTAVYINAVHRRMAVWQQQDTGTIAAAQPSTYASLETALMMETFQATGLEYHSSWAFHRYALAEARAGRPLGTPLSESRQITVGERRYAIQSFALDTLYTPIAANERTTDWGDVRRMSDLLDAARPQPATLP